MTRRACSISSAVGVKIFVQRADLRRVDRPFAVKAHVARALGGGGEGVVDGDAEVRAVDRDEVVRPRGQQDLVLNRQPRVQRGARAGGAAEGRRQIRVAEDGTVEPRRRAGDAAGTREYACGGLDQCLHAHPADR